jgi:hypothetical protein
MPKVFIRVNRSVIDIANAQDSGKARFVTFVGTNRVVAGALAEVAAGAWRALARDAAAKVLVFDVTTGDIVDLDLRGAEADVIARYTPAAAATTRGRPKLGVVAREVTLLPRHWDWLATQPGGASVALRRLVEAARKSNVDASATRARAEAAYRFMSAMAGDLPGFEEAARDLFSGDRPGLARRIRHWPQDVQDQLLRQMFGEADDEARLT